MLPNPNGPLKFNMWAEYKDRNEYIGEANGTDEAIAMSNEARANDHQDALRVFGVFSRM